MRNWAYAAVFFEGVGGCDSRRSHDYLCVICSGRTRGRRMPEGLKLFDLDMLENTSRHAAWNGLSRVCIYFPWPCRPSLLPGVIFHHIHHGGPPHAHSNPFAKPFADRSHATCAAKRVGTAAATTTKSTRLRGSRALDGQRGLREQVPPILQRLGSLQRSGHSESVCVVSRYASHTWTKRKPRSHRHQRLPVFSGM